jgi:hypothetical protein
MPEKVGRRKTTGVRLHSLKAACLASTWIYEYHMKMKIKQFTWKDVLAGITEDDKRATALSIVAPVCFTSFVNSKVSQDLLAFWHGDYSHESNPKTSLEARSRPQNWGQ